VTADDAASDGVTVRPGPDNDLSERSNPDDGESPKEALRRIVNELDTGDPWTFAGGHSGRWGRAGVCRVRPRSARNRGEHDGRAAA